MKTNSLGFIGGGRITRIFLQAFLNKKMEFDQVLIYDTNKETLNNLGLEFPTIKASESIQQVAQQSLVFIALHPPIIMEMLEHIKESVSEDTTLISLAPKVTLDKISTKLKIRNLVRMIPNATSYINQGYNPVTFSENFNRDDKPVLMELFKLLGETFEVAESKLEAYAIMSAMLPTYFWFQWNELSKVGTQLGLSEEESRNSVQHTLEAANNLLFKSGLSSEKVMDLIPVKPIAEHETQIKEIYQTKLTGLFDMIKP